jgi:hypothetical protein
VIVHRRRFTAVAVAVAAIGTVLVAGGTSGAESPSAPPSAASFGANAPRVVPDTTAAPTAPDETDETAPPATIRPVEPAVESDAPSGPGAGFVTGPTVDTDVSSAEAGERVTVRIDGFDSLWVTVTVCGNEARRGSSDCNVTGSVTNEFNEARDPMALSYVVTAPPVDCPCVIRVVGRDTTEMAITPFEVVGHPVGPLQDPAVVANLFSATVTARNRSSGALDAIRSEMGGPATYEVTVRVTNTTTTPLRQIRLSGSAGRNPEERSTTLELDTPSVIGVGQTWEQTVTAVIPAPSFGTFTWEVAVSGAGPTMVATSTTTHRPWLLIVLVMLIAINICVVILRVFARRRHRREGAGTPDDPVHVTPDGVSHPGEAPRQTVAATAAAD